MAKDFTPHAYQQYGIDRIIDTRYTGMFLDMGLGKTVITLTALHELKYYRCCIRKALVIAPKKVAESTWTNEQKKWNHLKNLRLSVALGNEKQRLAALEAPADVYIINRENVQWLVQTYGYGWPFDVVVLDESSSFKNPQAKRFKALKAVRPHISRIIELTGTPSANGLMDLWAQLYLLDQGKRLGRTISVYREMFFDPDKRDRTTIFSYKLKEGAEQAIYDLIGDICVSMDAKDYLSLPECICDDIPVKLDDKTQRAYNQMEHDMLIEVDDELITATSAAALSGKLLQLCNGAVYDEDGNAITIHDCKIEVLLETIEQLNGQHAIIYYNFKHDKDRLLDALSRTKLTVRVYAGPKDENDWNAGKIDLLLAQPVSCGYGLNLQDGGHHVIWFGLTWSLEVYQQANKRLHRQGQQYPVIIHRLITQGGTDEDVIGSLECKDTSQKSLLDALKARVNKVKGGLPT
ncbi:MAG: DEAD/DEAH box helicase [Lachnospiraceae bacterium]|nr:DEAD/DEAH box helicase [Lachnospiraceae bacterium]